jgi:hypothetical protein
VLHTCVGRNSGKTRRNTNVAGRIQLESLDRYFNNENEAKISVRLEYLNQTFEIYMQKVPLSDNTLYIWIEH